MATRETSKSGARTDREGAARRKAAQPKAGAGGFVSNKRAASPRDVQHGVYSFSGEISDLATVLKETHVSGGYRAVVITETHEADDALKKAGRFREVRFSRGALRKKTSDKRRLFKEKGVETRQHEGQDVGDPMMVIEVRSPTADVTETREIAADAFRPDARARAILRGKDFAEADLKAAGGSFDVEEVRKLLNGVTRQAVDKRVNDGALLAVPGPSGHRRFPTVQFNPDGSVVAGLKVVMKALDFSSPWAVLNFLVNANDQLSGEKPIEALRKGPVDRVVLAASSVGVQGA